jgi:parallel beta-helix repeat protein
MATTAATVLVTGLHELPTRHLELFVAPNADHHHASTAARGAGHGGGGSGDGSAARPFRSLTQARNAVRLARRGGGFAGNATVHLGAGLYTAREGLPLALTAEDSGTAEAWTLFKGDPSDPPLLSGGVLVPARLFRPWVKHKSVLVADLTGLVDDTGAFGPPEAGGSHVGACFHNHSELFFDGRRQTVARWPNEFVEGSISYAGTELRRWARTAADNGSPVDPPIDEVIPATSEDCPALTNAWEQQGTGWLHGYWDEDWADQHVKLQSVASNGTLRMLCRQRHSTQSGAVAGCQKVLPGARWYAQNLLSECDTKSEYFIDRAQRRLYFYPPSSITAASDGTACGVFLSMAQHVITATQTSYVSFEGVKIAHSRGDGVVAIGVTQFRLENCTIENLGGNGTTLVGSGSAVVDTVVRNVGCTAISALGGHPAQLLRGDNVISGCTLSLFAQWKRTYQPAIFWAGVGNSFLSNLISWAPHNAILGGGASAVCFPSLTNANDRPCGGNDNRFAFNVIEHVGYECTDTGAFYTDGPGGQAWVNRGNVIEHNIFRHIHTAEATPDAQDTHSIPSTLQAVYLDDLISGWLIQNNTFFDCEVGILMGGGRQNIVRGNNFANCTKAIQFDWRANDSSCVYNASTVNQPRTFAEASRLPAWKKYSMTQDYPCLPAHCVIEGNVFCNNAKDINVCGADQLGCGKTDCYCDNLGTTADIAKWQSVLGPNRNCATIHEHKPANVDNNISKVEPTTASNNTNGTMKYNTPASCGPTDNAGDCQALADLAVSARVSGWKAHSGWGTQTSVCSWHGVACGTDGRVTAVNITQNNLAGSLPESVGRLSELQILDIKGTRPEGYGPRSCLSVGRGLNQGGNNFNNSVLPHSFYSLHKLKIWSMEYTCLGGTLSSMLGAMKSLQHIWIHGNFISGTIPTSLDV